MAGRELAFVRIFEAPRELVWKAWTDPQIFARWMGPRGFTTTPLETPPVRPGASWTYTMAHAQYGTFPNRVDFLEVVAPERLVYRLGSGGAADDSFQSTLIFEPHPRGTKLTMRAVFKTEAELENAVRNFKAVEGGNETHDRLAEQLGGAAMPFVITRHFDAPRTLVWKAWTEREQLMKWFGPKGFTMTKATLDFRPGGRFHYCLKAPDGSEMWGLFAYREIEAPERIVHVHSFSDAKGGKTHHPMSPTWPLEMLATTTMTEIDGRTFVTVHWFPIDPTPEGRATFEGGRDGMRVGWGGTFDQLAAYLATSRT